MAELIRQEIAGLLVKRVKDPTLHDVTLTEVKVSPDLSVATVYFAAAGEAEAAVIRAGLERATPFFRREMGRVLKAKRTPVLRFHRDEALEEGMHIDSILREIIPADEEEEP